MVPLVVHRRNVVKNLSLSGSKAVTKFDLTL